MNFESRRSIGCSIQLGENVAGLPEIFSYIILTMLTILTYRRDFNFDNLGIPSIISKHVKDGQRGVTQSFWINLVNCKDI